MKKKIFAIDQGEHLGGAERFFAQLLTRLSNHDEVHLITDHHRAYHKLYEGSTVRIHEASLPALKPLGLKTFRAFRNSQKKLYILLQSINPDLIISNTVRTHLLISSPAKRLRKKLVWMAHDRTFPPLLLRYFGRYPNLIIACSKYIQSFCQRYSRAPCEVLYPFGIDRLPDLVTKKKIIGMIGNFIPWKSHDLFLEMASVLHGQYSDYRFVIIGSLYYGNPESQRFFEECLQLIEKFQLSSVVEIKRNVVDLMKEIGSWEILVHGSKEPEPLGRVILEGMAAGCAVIASNLGGPKEIVEHGKTGFLVKPEANEIIQSVIQCLENSEQTKQMIQNAQGFIEKNFLWKKIMGDCIIPWLQKIMGD